MTTNGALMDAPHPAGAAGAASMPRRVGAQAAFEMRAVLRNGEQLLVTIALPLVALVALARGPFELTATTGGDRLGTLTPAVLALGVLAAAFTSPAIATAFDRRYGVLRLLATTPLRRGGLLAGKVVAVLGVQLVQGVLVVGTAAALGWRPPAGGLLAAVGVAVLGTAAFVALALLVAGTLRAEATLALANLLMVLLALGGGMLVPADDLPGPLSSLAPWLPSGALTAALGAVLRGETFPAAPVLVLVAWAAALSAGAARWFRWD